MYVDQLDSSPDLKAAVKKGFVNQVKHLWESIKISLFVIGTSILVFIAARNSITWYFQRFWGASGYYWQSKWEEIYDFFAGNDTLLWFSGLFFICNGSFWVMNSLFAILDLTGKPQCLMKYKIQLDKNMPVDYKKLEKAVLQAFFNQFIVGGPFMYLTYFIMLWRGCSFGRELPTFHWVIVEMVAFVIVEEILFYYSHRLFHMSVFYRHIHKIHHEWTSPVGVTSIYAHPIEHILANLLPIVMGPILMKSHVATALMWFTLALASTTISHCGYHLPFLPSPEAHDFHHFKFVNNFGVLGVMDRLHGTDKLFRASKAYDRHIMLLGFVPLSQQFPDDVKTEKSKQCTTSSEESDKTNTVF